MMEQFPIPKILWIAIFSLAVFAIFHFIVGLSNPIQFLAFAINLVLIFGLLRLAKWAYFISILASIMGPFLLSFEMTKYFYIVLILNSTVLIPVLLCTTAFFTKKVSQSVRA